jgi:hypothetical protein
MSSKNKQIKSVVAKNAIDKAKAAVKRQIIIETDGNSINVVKADVAGTLELIAIMNSIIGFYGKK